LGSRGASTPRGWWALSGKQGAERIAPGIRNHGARRLRNRSLRPRDVSQDGISAAGPKSCSPVFPVPIGDLSWVNGGWDAEEFVGRPVEKNAGVFGYS